VSDSFGAIFLTNKKLSVKRKGQKTSENLLPREGRITVQNPHRFIHELIEIGGFSKTLTTRE
jgi:hypothetical protein